MMQLMDDWRAVLRKAWSLRLVAVAVLLLLLDIGAVVLEGLGLVADRPALSIALRAGAAALGVASFVARLVYQPGMH